MTSNPTRRSENSKGANTSARAKNTSGKGKTPIFGPPVDEALSSPDVIVGAVLMRNAVVREQMVTVRRVMTVSGGIITILLVLVAIVASRPRHNDYFATDASGRITPIVPINHPIDSVPYIGQWTVNALTAVNTYDSANYSRMLTDALQKYFTVSGANAYLDALKASNQLETVKDEKLMVSAVARNAPVLLNSGHGAGGRYEWIFQIPFVVTFQGLNRKIPQTVTYTVTVVRADVTKHPSGLAIQSVDFRTQN